MGLLTNIPSRAILPSAVNYRRSFAKKASVAKNAPGLRRGLTDFPFRAIKKPSRKSVGSRVSAGGRKHREDKTKNLDRFRQVCYKGVKGKSERSPGQRSTERVPKAEHLDNHLRERVNVGRRSPQFAGRSAERFRKFRLRKRYSPLRGIIAFFDTSDLPETSSFSGRSLASKRRGKRFFSQKSKKVPV